MYTLDVLDKCDVPKLGRNNLKTRKNDHKFPQYLIEY